MKRHNLRIGKLQRFWFRSCIPSYDPWFLPFFFTTTDFQKIFATALLKHLRTSYTKRHNQYTRFCSPQNTTMAAKQE